MSNKYNVGVVRNDAVCEEGRDRVLALGDSVASHKDKPPRPTANFLIRGKGVQLMIDSGSLYTILPKKLFLQEWPAVSLLPKDISPGGYQGEKIDILGYMWAKIEFGKRHINGKVYIADSGPPILGWHHQYDLDIKIDPRAQENVMLIGDEEADVSFLPVALLLCAGGVLRGCRRCCCWRGRVPVWPHHCARFVSERGLGLLRHPALLGDR
ncbi:hypothetical protein NDU88_001970 [Pleurodeles waltl]|uniref:Peptidase A2 domain-containing protein n=1 Tax=Pleurodeles waltl TaxID=8319 RepID=A0AAV7SCD1_PLEWA|nr:hypothetical protein NDU88_001970 [Pleurodeles waltl]